MFMNKRIVLGALIVSSSFLGACDVTYRDTTAAATAGSGSVVSGGSSAVIPACGSASGNSFAAAPSSGLCSVGTSSSVVALGSNYAWSCVSGSNTAACLASNIAISVAACGSAKGGTFSLAPSADLCASGNSSAVVKSGSLFSWSCSVGSSNANCNANVAVSSASPVCGSANGLTFSSQPSANLCSVGSASSVTLSGSYYDWSCSEGSDRINCSANKASTASTCSGFTSSSGACFPSGTEVGRGFEVWPSLTGSSCIRGGTTNPTPYDCVLIGESGAHDVKCNHTGVESDTAVHTHQFSCPAGTTMTHETSYAASSSPYLQAWMPLYTPCSKAVGGAGELVYWAYGYNLTVAHKILKCVAN